MRQTEETPMGEILSWRLLLLEVSRTTTQHRPTYWNEVGDILTYVGTALHLGKILELLHINFAAVRSRPSMPRRKGLSLNDNLGNVLLHAYFYDFNKTTLLCTELLREVCTVPTLAENFFVGDLTAPKFPTFSVDAMRTYENFLKCFLRRPLVLIYVGSFYASCSRCGLPSVGPATKASRRHPTCGLQGTRFWPTSIYRAA